jgi:hypothetical protein
MSEPAPQAENGDLPLIGSAKDLLDLAELSDIVYYAVSATRRDEAGPEGTSHEFAIFVLHDGARIEVRCRAVVDTSDAQYVVDASSRFELKHPVEITDDAKQEFVEKVGLMAVYPYIRETVAASAAKLRLAQPLVGLLQAGNVSITPTKPAADVTDQPSDG